MKTRLAGLGLLFLPVLLACSTTQQISSSGTNMCMTVPYHGAPVAGAPLKVRGCDPWQNQQWSLQKNGQITGVGGYCLDVAGGEAKDGAAVIYVPCTDAPSQHWSAVNGTIVGIGGKCLDIGGGTASDMAALIITPCSGAPSQSWQLH
jgi:hypothetical protein